MRQSAAVAVLLGLVLAACQQSVFELAIGQCIDLPSDTSEVSSVTEVECEMPHDAEVYALPQHPGGPDDPFPGDQVIGDFADERCNEAFEPYVGVPFEESAIFVTILRPTQQSWDQADDREVACLLVGENGAQLTGSKRNSNE